MKQIVCELCEGTEFTKIDGMFVCSNCGTKYSAEEAKNMMREVEGESPVVAGTPVTSVPQGNQNQQHLENILMLATNAYAADNNKETENYCNRAIELDASCYKAWVLKGKAIGWSSTLDNNRMEEAAHSFMQAINFAPDDEKDAIREEASNELKRLGLACVSVRQKRFSKYPDAEELNGFVNDLKPLVNALMVIADKSKTSEATGVFEELDALLGQGTIGMRFLAMKMKGTEAGIPEDFFSQIANMMNLAGVAGFNTTRDKYNNDNHPYKRDFENAMNAANNCIALIKCAIDASDDDEDIIRYKNLIVINNFAIDMTAYGSSSSYRSLSLASEAKEARRKHNKEWEDKIKELEEAAEKAKAEAEKAEEEAKKARIAAYWEAHADEKNALDSELKDLEAKKEELTKNIADLDSQISEAQPTGNVPSEDEKDAIKNQIRELESQRSKLGLFAGKEKKQIGEKIASLEGRISALEVKIEEEKNARNAEADKTIAPLKTKKDELQEQLGTVTKRIAAINKELTKDPEE